MQTHIATTPFGRRTMSLAQVAEQTSARAAPKDRIVHKWQVFHHIREARDRLGATDRALTILNALLSFHPETTLAGGADIIVWPSNEQLAARANGMPATTLRRHLAVLVDCGLVIRRDSPNGKRFARKDRAGDIAQVYGFDLAPIVARAEAFKAMAEAVQADKHARQVAREQLTLLRRDIVKTIAAARQEAAPGPWDSLQHRYQDIIGRLPRQAGTAIIAAICGELGGLWREIRTSLENLAQSRIQVANESHSGGHIKESNPESHHELEKSYARQQAEKAALEKPAIANPFGRETGWKFSLHPGKALSLHPGLGQKNPDPSLATVIKACPALVELAQGRAIRDWRDLLGIAGLVRPMLGISVKSWEETCATLGPQRAATLLAALYERSGQIANPGGYLRNLTERAIQGRFSTTPMILALLTAQLKGRRGGEALHHPAPAVEPPKGEGHPTPPAITVSAALRQKLRSGATRRPRAGGEKNDFPGCPLGGCPIN
ncbi:plasmid replication protein RepC [Chelatococcus sp. HY11]|uniref:plasmid replication protein RepC n=1 Tax=Chelatococcus sp. HY11 TaxID=2835634 RepID=UPI001BCCF6AD|nr:plasmid replication protein RepC [Chelatococcus sp. HY11]MBS7743554.1 replication initiation protein RepC [Chelatococcus sp. HY11]CAH1664042.1 putative replication protein C [Hyphomicrobiales bacterium]CAH1688052.1 putative replication protein C [Hyphomicrobiales bacterium]